MSEDAENKRRRGEIRDEINRLVEEYVRLSNMILPTEIITNWVILLPSAGIDSDGDNASYVHSIFRDEQIPAWQLMGMLQHEMATTQAMVMSREWAGGGSSEEDE